MTTRFQQIQALLVVVTLLSAPVIGSGGAIVGQSTTAQSLSSSVDTVDLTENVSVWERSALPFRLDTSDGRKTITLGSVFANLQAQNTGDVAANIREMAVYRDGSTVSATFESVTGAGTSTFASKDSQLVVARLSPDAPSDVSEGVTMSDILDLADPSTVNGNATFEVIDTSQISSDGSLTVNYTFDKPGRYVFFLSVGSGTFSATNGDLSVSGETTIVGFDTALVETAPSSVSAPDTVERGTNFTVTADTPSTSPLNHTVLLYEREAFVNSETTFVLEDDLSRNLTAEDLTIRHSVSAVNGVARVNGTVTIADRTFNDGHLAGQFTGSQLLELVGERISDDRLNSSNVTLEQTGSTVLDASLSGATDVRGPQTLNVTTFENWSTGTYVWVHLAGNGTDVYTDVGTVKVQNASQAGDGNETEGGENETAPGDGGTPPAGGAPPSDGAPPTTTPPTTTPPTNNTGKVSITRTGEQITVNISTTQRNQSVVVDLPDQSQATNGSAANQATSVQRLTINFSEPTSFNMSVRNRQTANVNPVSSEEDLGYIQVNHTQSDKAINSVTFSFSVSKEKLEQRNIDPEDVRLYRYNNDSWNGLPTTQTGETQTGYTYKAVSPGLSLFAVSKAQPVFNIVNTSLSSETVQAGESITVTATVNNTGAAEGEFTANLTADGTVISSATATIAEGESRVFTFTPTFESAGSRTLQVNGNTVGTVQVTKPQSTTTTTTAGEQRTTLPAQARGGGELSLLVGLVVIALSIVGVYFYRRRE